MSKQYIVTRSFYEGNGLHEAGNSFEHKDQAYIKKNLADGNIKEVGAEEESSSAAPSAPESVAATEGEANSTNPLPEQPVASASQSVETPAPEATAPQAVSPVEQAPTQDQAAQPTQSEIEATLAASEGDSQEPSNEVQIS